MDCCYTPEFKYRGDKKELTKYGQKGRRRKPSECGATKVERKEYFKEKEVISCHQVKQRVLHLDGDGDAIITL